MNKFEINAVYNNLCYDTDKNRINEWMDFNILGFYKVLNLITNKSDPLIEKMSIDNKINYKYNFKLLSKAFNIEDVKVFDANNKYDFCISSNYPDDDYDYIQGLNDNNGCNISVIIKKLNLDIPYNISYFDPYDYRGNNPYLIFRIDFMNNIDMDNYISTSSISFNILSNTHTIDNSINDKGLDSITLNNRNLLDDENLKFLSLYDNKIISVKDVIHCVDDIVDIDLSLNRSKRYKLDNFRVSSYSPNNYVYTNGENYNVKKYY